MRVITFILLSLIFTSCVKDKPQDPLEPSATIGSGHKVYITNEGKFGGINASVSLYDPSNGQIISDVYKTQNNNAVLGDVCQSICRANNNYYVVVNNSGKIVVVNSDDFKQKGTITGLVSPRYLLPVTFQKAYVSDLYANSIAVIDLNTFQKTSSIPCSGWTEQMALIYNKAFVTNIKSNYVYIINTINDQVSDSVNVGVGAGSVVIDKNSKVWILSSGDQTNNIAGKLSRIDPVSLQVEQSWNFNSGQSPQALCCNGTKDTLYYLNNGVFRLPILNSNLPTSAFVTAGSSKFYGLGVDPFKFWVYVSDAIDYVQKSSILVYDQSGQLKSTFKAGINASSFYFE